MTIEVALLVALISCAVGVITFLVGRKTAHKKEGEEWGELKTDIGYIKRDISDIKDVLMVDMKASIRRLHKRIDNHLMREHHMVAPRDDDDNEV